MEQVFVNGLYFSIELIKILLVMVYIWKLTPKKNISYAFTICLLFVMCVSRFVDLSRVGLIYGVIIVFFMTLYLNGKYRFLLSALSFILISLADMFFSEIVVNLFHISFQTLMDNVYIEIACASISLVILFLYIILFGTKNIDKPKVTSVLLPIYILGGLALSVFVTGIQIIDMDDNNKIYHNVVFVGLILAGVFFVVVSIFLERDRRENERLNYINEMNSRLMEAQSDYYLRLLKKETETREFRHDIKAHLLCMGMLYDKGEYDKLGEYINEAQITVSRLSTTVDTGNDYVNAIVSDLSSRYPEVKLEWKGIIPVTILSYMDICTLFYNLLKNAYEAASETVEKKVEVEIRVQQLSMLLSISNNYKNVIGDNEGEFKTTKDGKGHGYGIRNIKRCVEKYHGEYNVVLENNIFITNIMILNVIEKIKE